MKRGNFFVERLGRDRGGTRCRPLGTTSGTPGQRVAAQTLLRLVQNESFDRIDAIKIDVEGSEDRILVPFFRDAPQSLWPKLLVIEDTRDVWLTDLFSFLSKVGYAIAARSKQNVMLRREIA